MDRTALAQDADACYRALKARDARFDGCFFTGVTSTGIYCRPVCSVRAPKRENCRFFDHAAQAEAAGFRPCLRCRPELAPRSPVLAESPDLPWSSQDASRVLAQQAARLLDEPQTWSALGGEAFSMALLARRLGVSTRHMRRIFDVQFGISPLQYLQTRRLLTAKQLLADTALPVTQIALISGYSSVRRFNSAFLSHYRLNPSTLRREGKAADRPGALIRLGFRPPYDAAAMVSFFAKRQLATIECADLNGLNYSRSLRLQVAGRAYTGWLRCSFDLPRHQLLLQVSDSLCEVLPLVIRKVRHTFDLDAAPDAINAVLNASFPGCEGLRVPGTFNGFELAVRAVLGQQITVAAARTLAQRLVASFGEPIETPFPLLSRLFPEPSTLANASADALGQLGIVKQRQVAIKALAHAVTTGTLQLNAGADVQHTMAQLKALPGVGDWTAHYIAMRALRWPDAFPAGDVALQKALGLHRSKRAAREAESASLAWKPWRSYALVRAWSRLDTPASMPSTRALESASATHFIATSAHSIRATALKRSEKQQEIAVLAPSSSTELARLSQ